jgi:preprotein translocase subunit SecF
MATVCIVCLIYGVSSIISFAFPLIVGMISGVYSSNCIAPTLWVKWRRHKENNPKAKKGKKTAKKTSRR